MPDIALSKHDRAKIRDNTVPVKLHAGSIMLASFACTDYYAPLWAAAACWSAIGRRTWQNMAYPWQA